MSEIVIHSRQVEMVPVSALKGYEKNARKHSSEQINTLAAIVRDSGFTSPLIIDEDDVIVAGHGRLEVAKKLKMTEVPCVRAKNLTPEQLKALRLSDNAVGLLSGWDEGLLKLELADLQGAGFDLSLTAFTSLELTGIFSSKDGLTEPDDDVVDPPAAPVTTLGDLWRVGDHWLLCGDATDPATVERVFGGYKPHLMVTDPPYGVNYDPTWREEAAKKGLIGFSPSALGKVSNDGRIDWRQAWALFPGDVVYCWHAGRHASEVQVSLEAAGFEIRCQIIWAKSSFAISRGHYNWQHEPCWYAVKKGANGHWGGTKSETTLWSIAHNKNATGHSTQKPVETMKRPIENNSKPGDHVYDPFVGSGTTLLACEMTKRVGHCLDIDPAYIDVVLLRFTAFTGVQPTLAETGETFEAVKARRSEVV